ncbi:MAG: MFS transporter [Tissierellia bacterium]|nr:MFS transporter [Tissierellia bacterium]
MSNKKMFSFILSSRLILNLADSFFFMVVLWHFTDMSPLYVGTIMFFYSLADVCSMFFGPIIDRLETKQSLTMVALIQMAIALLSIVLLGVFGLTREYIPLVFIAALSSSISYNIQETLVPLLVEDEYLTKANSLLELTDQTADLIFNAIAGISIVYFGLKELLGFDVLLFLIAIFVIRKISFKKFNAGYEKEEFNYRTYKKDLKGGLKELFHQKYLVYLIPLLIVNFFVSILNVSMPIFSNEFMEPSKVYGFLMGISGGGAVLGALFLQKFELTLKQSLVLYGILDGMVYFLMAYVPNLYLIYALYGISGFCSTIININYETAFQKLMPKNMVGRINTAIETAICLAMPIGALAGGALLKLIDVRITFIIYGVISVLLSGWYLLRLDKNA